MYIYGMAEICKVCLNRNIFYFKKIFIQIFSCKKVYSCETVTKGVCIIVMNTDIIVHAL